LRRPVAERRFRSLNRPTVRFGNGGRAGFFFLVSLFSKE
jgi:hypothetical protein